jgi:hypothetical protein
MFDRCCTLGEKEKKKEKERERRRERLEILIKSSLS